MRSARPKVLHDVCGRPGLWYVLAAASAGRPARLALVGSEGGDQVEPEVRAIGEISTLVYAFRREDLFRALPLVGRENRQREFYLPDVLAILADKGERVAAVPVDVGGIWVGLNSRATLATLTEILRRR